MDERLDMYHAVMEMLAQLPHIEVMGRTRKTIVELGSDISVDTLLVRVGIEGLPSAATIHLLRIAHNPTLAHALDALQHGMSGYMGAEHLTVARLYGSLLTVAAGGVYLDRWVTNQLSNPTLLLQTMLPSAESASPLSDSDRELLRAIALGLNNKQIASKQNVTAKTIANRLSPLYRKIGASNRVEAAFYALQSGQVSILEVVHWRRE